MMTVNQVSKLTGVSIRTLQYYDKIGLLKATSYTESGYRLYDDSVLERLQQILLFKELEFSLKDIKQIMNNPNFDREKALEQQIELLSLKKEHIENLITLARGIKSTGGKNMSFNAFDKKKMNDYKKEAKNKWGKTTAYAEYEKKSKERSTETESMLGEGLMDIFAEMGKIKDSDASSEVAQLLVKKLQTYITEHYYNCTKQILAGLGIMYVGDSRFQENIDSVGGVGTAEFANEAIQVYCKK